MLLNFRSNLTGRLISGASKVASPFYQSTQIQITERDKESTIFQAETCQAHSWGQVKDSFRILSMGETHWDPFIRADLNQVRMNLYPILFQTALKSSSLLLSPTQPSRLKLTNQGLFMNPWMKTVKILRYLILVLSWESITNNSLVEAPWKSLLLVIRSASSILIRMWNGIAGTTAITTQL